MVVGHWIVKVVVIFKAFDLLKKIKAFSISVTQIKFMVHITTLSLHIR
jgi:hypothetical protein